MLPNRMRILSDQSSGSSPMSDLVGTTIGPYQITERLGRGGMADVYKAFHRELSIHRAIKPDNIMLDLNGRPVLMDFGIAKLVPVQGSPRPA